MTKVLLLRTCICMPLASRGCGIRGIGAVHPTLAVPASGYAVERFLGAATTLQQDLFDLKDKVAAADYLANALASAQSFAVASDSLDPTSRLEQLKDQIDEGHLQPRQLAIQREGNNCTSETLQLKQDIAGLANLPGYDDWKASAGVKDRLSAFSR
jgi:hypothetical protein